MGKKNGSHLRMFILLPFLAVFIISGCKVAGILYDSAVQRQKFNSLSDEFYGAGAQEGTQPDKMYTDAVEESEMMPKFKALYEQNSDLGGWIRIEGTDIDYPVMFTPEEPQKYLRMAFDGTYSIYGVPFFGAGCNLDPLSDDLFVYGHNMNDGSIFAALLKYKDKRFWEEHRIVELDTLYKTYRYEIFAALTTDLASAETEHFYDYTDNIDEKNYTDLVSDIEAAALYETGVKAIYGDKLLTISTCSYHAEDGRLLVVAKLLPQE